MRYATSDLQEMVRQVHASIVIEDMLKEWSGRHVLILGAARQGAALARYLVQHGAHVTLNDRQPEEKLGAAMAALRDLGKSVRWVTGGHPLELLDQTDLVCVSGGVPLNNPIIAEAKVRGIPLSNDSQIFLEVAPCKVIGITGSAGKTTTTTLVGRIANESYRSKFEGGLRQANKVFVGGNIGSPLIASVSEMRPADLAVMELSSFQLEIMTRSPQVAAILNVTPNHLDRHETMEVYTAAKRRILAYQAQDDAAILGRDDPGSRSLVNQVKGKLFTFGLTRPESGAGTYVRGDDLYYTDGNTETRLMPSSSVQMRGEHNLLNVLAACAIAVAAGLPVEAMRAGIEGFTGVPHRLEFVRHWGGADWYNDSIATAPERAMAAIRSFTGPIILLAGGRDKDLPWGEFADLVRERVDHLILFGEAAGKIAFALGDYPHVSCANLSEAVKAAVRLVEPGDVVLLSPGGTSFDEFTDFEERGICFKQLVMSL
jgi:UDP-N-acetylmuramoylalanine--D-glutamate ligase